MSQSGSPHLHGPWQPGSVFSGGGWGGWFTRKDWNGDLTAPSVPSALCPRRLPPLPPPDPSQSHFPLPLGCPGHGLPSRVHTVMPHRSLSRICPQGPVPLPPRPPPVPLTPQLFPTVTGLLRPQLTHHSHRTRPSESCRLPQLCPLPRVPSGSEDPVRRTLPCPRVS